MNIPAVDYDNLRVRKGEMPSSNGNTNAKSLAKLGALMVNYYFILNYSLKV